jgi:hypothetical protein
MFVRMANSSKFGTLLFLTLQQIVLEKNRNRCCEVDLVLDSRRLERIFAWQDVGEE